MARKMHKKGMSPLIATVLLIAFAVSVGATVMSVGGVYYEKLRTSEGDCSESLLSVFELENTDECKSYEFNPIINFYGSNENVKSPKCYKVVGTGKGELCSSKDLSANTWAPAKELIR